MIPTTRFVDYNVSDNIRMAEIAKEFFPIFEEASTKLKEAKEAKEKSKKAKKDKDAPKPPTPPNDIYINPGIKVEFVKLQDAKMPTHLIIDKYDEWFEELYRLTTVNEPWLGHDAVFKHLAEILSICATIQDILDFAKQGLPEELV